MMAARLRATLPSATWAVTVVDRDNRHLYQPGLLFVPFNESGCEPLFRARDRTLPPGVTFVEAEIECVVPEENRVELSNGDRLNYDVLIVATGCRTVPEATEGLTATGWNKTAFDFYTPEGATALATNLATMDAGRLVIDIAAMPIKCPVAPLELAFLADAFFTGRGVRDSVEIVYATPLDAAFTKPVASRMLGDLLERKGVTLVSDFVASHVDGEQRMLHGYDGRSIAYDTLVMVPLHFGAESILRSGLGDDMGFVPTDKHTLQSLNHDNVFAVGDAANLPTSKAGAVAHFQSEVLHDNIVRFINGRPLLPAFDGHANCFIETGHDKAMLIDFNYETEPLPGKFPLPGLGPFSLLTESHVNHWGKLAFEWVYWNVLLRGAPLPLDHRMAIAGKWRDR